VIATPSLRLFKRSQRRSPVNTGVKYVSTPEQKCISKRHKKAPARTYLTMFTERAAIATSSRNQFAATRAAVRFQMRKVADDIAIDIRNRVGAVRTGGHHSIKIRKKQKTQQIEGTSLALVPQEKI
jgi:hypothetical protein